MIFADSVTKEVTPMRDSQRENVVRGFSGLPQKSQIFVGDFSLVHDPEGSHYRVGDEGSHYILEGKEKALVPGQSGNVIATACHPERGEGSDARDSSVALLPQNDTRSKRFRMTKRMWQSQKGQPELKQAKLNRFVDVRNQSSSLEGSTPGERFNKLNILIRRNI